MCVCVCVCVCVGWGRGEAKWLKYMIWLFAVHRCTWTDKWINTRWYTHIHTPWNSIQANKEEKSVFWNNMDVSWRHYAKWNKSGWERQILYILNYMQYLKCQTHRNKWYNCGFKWPGKWCGRNGKMLVKVYKLPPIK